MIFDEHGRKVYRGQEALDKFTKDVRHMLEGRKLHYKTSFQDIPVSIENRKGSIRSGVDPDGDEWKTRMKKPYGYIPGTKGVDGDALDVYVGPDENAAYAYIVHSNNIETGKFDEDKVMLGFGSSSAAKNCFLDHYDDPKFFGGIDSIPMWQFVKRVWVKKETSKKLVASRRLGESRRITIEDGDTPIIIIVPPTPSKGGGSEIKKPSYDAGFIPAGMFASGSLTREVGQDNQMRRSILGHHQDIIPNPETREGGPGSGPHKKQSDMADPAFITQLQKLAKALGDRGEKLKKLIPEKESREHGVKGQKWSNKKEDPGHKAASDLRKSVDEMANMRKSFGNLFQSGELFRTPKKEAEEHGVKGMKWGVKHARHDAAGQKGTTGKTKSIANRDLSHDPKTLNMMQNVRSAEQNLNTGQKTGSPAKDHDIAKQMLTQLGWKVAGTAARLAGLGGVFQAVQSVVKTPDGQKMYLQTGKDGSHGVTSDKQGKQQPHLKQPQPIRTRTSIRESRPFEERLGSFLREAKKKKVYYARSLQRYGSSREAGERSILEDEYPDHHIVAPRTMRHAELGMGYFHDKIDEADEVVITPFRGRHVTAGVFSEARHALKRGIPVRVLRRDGSLRTVKDLKMNKAGNPGGEYARIILKTKSTRKSRKS